MTKETAIKGKLFSFGVFYQPQSVCGAEEKGKRFSATLFTTKKGSRYRKWMPPPPKNFPCLVLRTINWKLKTKAAREWCDDGDWKVREVFAHVETLSVCARSRFGREEVTSAPSALLESDLNFSTLLCHFTSIQLRCKVDKWVGIKRTVFSFSLLFICLIRRQPKKAQKGSFYGCSLSENFFDVFIHFWCQRRTLRG